MPIPLGTRIGPFEVVGWLGAGGMGEVYRARDPRIGRDVAIKLIRDTFANDPGRVSRFEQEARAAGQINHPNILAVYDVGTHAGVPFIVSELLEGESLRSRLSGGALTPKKAVDFAWQIADGLAAAHDRGIVHRDLKPENLFVTADGRLKILDFGIAKLTRPNEDTSSETNAATETQPGMVVGTVGYMSPEQVRGEPVDHRSDLFNFGAIFYEMLTGRVAFTRGTAADTLAAILKEEPVEPLPASVPPALARIVSRCLEKPREARFQSARDLAFGLEFLSGEEFAASGARPIAIRRPWFRQPVVVGVLGGALIVALTLALKSGTASIFGSPPATSTPTVAFPYTLPQGQQLDASGGAHTVALSPNGLTLAYVASPNKLYLRPLASLYGKSIPGVEPYEGVREPVFSPNSQSIAFYVFGDRTLRRMPVVGGDAVILARDVDTPTGMTWGADGIVYGQGARGIFRVLENGGKPQHIVAVKESEEAHGPQVLLDGRFVLFTLATGTGPGRWDHARIVVQSLTGADAPKELFPGGSDARYVSTGHIVYANGNKLYARTFDLERLQPGAQIESIVDDIGRASGDFTGAAQFSFSDDGIFVSVPGSSSPEQLDLALMDRTWVPRPLNLKPGPYAVPRVSPDSNRLAFGTAEGGKIYISDLSGANRHELPSGGNDRYPTWSNDSKRIVFQSSRQGDAGLYTQDADGGQDARLLLKAQPGELLAPESWHPKEDLLLFSVTRGSIVTLETYSPSKKKREPYGTIRSENPTGATFSPDGHWVAYSTTEQGVTSMHVSSFPVPDTNYLLPSSPADTPKHPVWALNGREIFFNPRASDFEVVSITLQPFSVGQPTKVPKIIQGGPPGARTPYDIIPRTGEIVGVIAAGQGRFLRTSTNEIIVRTDWFFKQLRALLPPR